MVVAELHARLPIGRVELVRNVPAQRSELPSLLHYRVHERHAIEHGLPLRQVADVQEILRDSYAQVHTEKNSPSMNALL